MEGDLIYVQRQPAPDFPLAPIFEPLQDSLRGGTEEAAQTTLLGYLSHSLFKPFRRLAGAIGLACFQPFKQSKQRIS